MTRKYGIVVVGPAARTIAERLPEAVAHAVIELITGPLPSDPHRLGKPLHPPLEGIYSARRGTYRVLYRIDESKRQVIVLRVEHRRNAYRRR